MSKEGLFASIDIVVDPADQGGVILSNRIALPDYSGSLTARLAQWREACPDRIFLSEIPEGLFGENNRIFYSYARIDAMVTAMARHFLDQGIGRDNPPMIIANNSVAHAVAMLGAMRAGLAAAIVPPSAVDKAAQPFAKFDKMLAAIRPGVILAENPALCTSAIKQLGASKITIEHLSLPSVGDGASRDDFPELTADSIGKFLFTSGSTGSPKAVPQSQRMMVSNMQAYGELWLFLKHTPPLMVDWLPWSHVFGGNCCFNLALYFGGTVHIDKGNPSPKGMQHSIAAIAANKLNMYFNVPMGYEALARTLRERDDLAAHFFADLHFLFNAGAALPASTRAQLETLSARWTSNSPPIIGGWGATETAPTSTAIYFDNADAGNLGLPIPGTEIKMVPDGDGFELRVRGPNVMPGYWRDEKSTNEAFDEDGFFRIGDRGNFAEPDRPGSGIIFDGRLAENFKLLSGTWVNVGALRLALIEKGKPLIQDVVLAGEGRDKIAALIFLSRPGCSAYLHSQSNDAGEGDEMATHPDVRAAIEALLREHNALNPGSSRRIAFFRLQSEEPIISANEITEKGYINQRAVLKRRSAEVEAAYAGKPL
ncbi:hypothetical protein NOLU111490_11880 [Novosphingobium lubricantis]|jgi:feruloyl-CoA synthase